MRFYLEMDLDIPELGKEYRRAILSFIKRTLTECNDGKYQDVYFHNTDQKDYTFVVLLKGVKFVGDKMILTDNRIRIRFSADNRTKTGLRLMNGFLKQKNRSFPLSGGNTMTLRNVVQEKRDVITNSKVLLRTAVGGGLCIREHNKENNQDRYYTILDKEFKDMVQISLKNQALSAGFGERISNGLSFNPVEGKKIVVKHYGVMLDITVGSFELEGDSSLIQYFYDTGFGSRKSEGFNFFDLISQDFD